MAPVPTNAHTEQISTNCHRDRSHTHKTKKTFPSHCTRSSRLRVSLNIFQIPTQQKQSSQPARKKINRKRQARNSLRNIRLKTVEKQSVCCCRFCCCCCSICVSVRLWPTRKTNLESSASREFAKRERNRNRSRRAAQRRPHKAGHTNAPRMTQRWPI